MVGVNTTMQSQHCAQLSFVNFVTFVVQNITYRVAINFCGSLILQMGDFFCVSRELVFAIEKNCFFLAGN